MVVLTRALTLLLPLVAYAWVAPSVGYRGRRRLHPVRMAVTDTKGALKDSETRMQKSIDSLESSLGSIRTGRAKCVSLADGALSL